jgi:ribose transport system permease protein
LTSWASLKLILFLGVLIALSAVGQTLLILMGGFDLSVAGCIVAGTTILVLPQMLHVPFIVGVLIIVGVTATLGAAAGQICHRLELNPLIVTLATGAIALGMAQVVTGGQINASISYSPAWLTNLASPASHTFGLDLPPLILITVLVTCALAIFLHKTVPGARLFATGANLRGAQLSMVDTRRVWTATFAFSAVMSGLLGILLAGYTGGIDLGVGDPYLFLGVTAVFVGGTVFGGPGDYSRTVLGALFLQVLTVVLTGHGLGASDQQILYGVILLAAVTVYGRGARIRDRV